jgi:uncharacterized membrane protein YfcA
MDFAAIDATAWLLLVVAAFAAGVLNAVAGGGSFLTFPALVLAVSPGYAGSTLGFKAELQALPHQRLQREVLISAMGGVLGACLLLVTPSSVFVGLVPVLLLFATFLFAIGPRLAARADAPTQRSDSRWREPGLFGVAIYGGYFNGGLGILLMALYTLTGESRIHTVNALKNLNSLVLSVLSVGAFVVAGVMAWPQGLVMMVAATVGGFWGAQWSKRLPVLWVRRGVIATGLVMSAVFFVRAIG